MPAKSAVEEHANAKAAAEAAKAEAESLAAAKAAAEEALVPLAAAAVEAANEYVEADEQRNVAHLALGFRLLAVEAFLDSSVLEVSIGDWSESALPEVSGPSFGTSPAYRALQAARVAASIRGTVGGTSTDALRPMHRVKDVAGATTKVFAAAKAAAGRGKVVRKRHVEEALESLFPKDESASPGPKRGSTPKAAAKPRNTPTDGPLEVPDFAVSETRLKAALQRMTAVLQGEEVGTAWMIAAATAKCCTDYGTAATSAAIQSLAPKAAKAAKPRAKRTAAK